MEVILLENKLIVRRLIAGIFLILFAILVMSESLKMANVSSLLGGNSERAIMVAAGSGMILSIFAGITGVIYSATCKIHPNKIIEYVIVIVDIFIIFFVSTNQYASYYKDLIIFQFAFALFIVIGAPYKNGYKGMPFKKSNKKSPAAGVNTTRQQLNDLKEMLDDGTITQKEYDAKRKKILDI